MIKYFRKEGENVINIAICEDNARILTSLKEMVNKLVKEEHNVFPFLNGNDLLNRIENFQEATIDIVITDIEMPGLNGIEMAQNFKRLCPRVQFIFVTNYTDYIQDVFSVNPIHYILKPASEEKLNEALQKALQSLSEYDKRGIGITSKNKYVRIRFDDIKYIESYTRKIIVHEIGRNTEVLMKLDDFQSQLPSHFVRTHKSYCVNMNMVRSIGSNRIELYSGEVIPVAKLKYPEVKKQILSYLGSQL